MAAKPSGKFDTSIANLWTHCASHDRNEFIELSSNLKKKKKRKIIIFEKVLQTTFSLILLPSFSYYLRSSSAHVRQKGTRFRNEESFSRISKENLANCPRNRYPRNAVERHAIFNGGNLKTDAPTIRHTAETVKGAAGFCQVAFEKFDVSRSALNIVTWPT